METNINANINDYPLYLFHEGHNSESYKFFGVHKIDNTDDSWCFRVWAPKAKAVSVIGDFNNWDRNANEMKKIADEVWETVITDLKQFDAYKYSIISSDDRILEKADPYASHFETRPGTASKLYESSYTWGDSEWCQSLEKKNVYHSPMNIYEVHLGSWKQNPDGTYYDYVKFAKEMIPYIKKMNYTHIEFLPLTEHPFDGSWGYQVTGYFAPTSRYGTPDECRKMVDMFHQAGIGVILDWVPAHFPKDASGLCEFDGSYCYEYSDPLKMEHKSWGTRVFDYGKNEVRSFLSSSACYWFDEFHIDGLRVDAVASMLYLDYDRPNGQWRANKNGGNENLEAVEFLQNVNKAVFSKYPHALMIAEESTSWPLVTKPSDVGGLGFNFKWNMGWMNDMISYISLDPLYRAFNHNKLTFSFFYCFSENYVLSISHDEVVHLKCSMLNKMPGYLDDKFANLKAGYTFMFGHPGKKLLFMGNEFAQLQEWSEARELDWFLLKEDRHLHMQNYVRALLQLYKKYRCLYELDDSWDGFQWINADDRDRSIFSFVRKSKDGKNNMLFVINFTPVARDDYRVGVPKNKTYRLVLNSEDPAFNGTDTDRKKSYKATKSPCDGKKYSFAYPLPAYGVAVFKY